MAPALVLARPLSRRERDRVEALTRRRDYLRGRLAVATGTDATGAPNWWVRESSALDWVLLALAEPPADAAGLAEARRSDLVAAMAVIGDLMAATLSLEGQWSPELDKAREAGRTLLREWCAKT